MKKSLGKRVLKWTLWSLLALVVLILVGVTIVIHFIFTPAKLTPLVEKTAKEYLNAEVHFGNIELTFFSTFPDFGIQLDDASVISGTFRDSTANSEPTMQDSLMNIKSCLLTINPIAYLTKNRIVVKDFVLEQPDICLCRFGRCSQLGYTPDSGRYDYCRYNDGGYHYFRFGNTFAEC